MKSQDTTFSKAHLKDCINESSDASETCALALKKIRALEKKPANPDPGRFQLNSDEGGIPNDGKT